MINCRIKDKTGYTFDVDIPDYVMTGNGSEIKLADLDRSTVEEIICDFTTTIYSRTGMKRGGGVSVTPEQSEGAKPEVVQADGLPVSPASIHQYLDKLKPNPVPAAMPAVPILAPAMPMVSLSEPMDFKPKAQVIDTSLTWIGDDHSFAVYKYDGVWYLETNASDTINPDDCFLECGLTAHVEKIIGNCLSSVLTGSPDMFLYQVYVAEYEESACTVWYGSVDDSILAEPIAIPENIRGDDWFIHLIDGKHRLHIHVSCRLTVKQVLERAGIIGRADGYRETGGWIFRNADHGRADSYDLKIDSYNGIVAEGVEVTYD